MFVRRVFAGLRRRARSYLGVDDPRCGAVTFIQRFGGALNLNVHFHTLVLDGVFDPDDSLRFLPLPPPKDDEVARTLRTTASGIARLLERLGLGRDAEPDFTDPLDRDQRLIAALVAASVRGRIATSPRAGQEVMRFGDRIDPDRLACTETPRCATIGGLSLHANVAVPARDRARLERLCRYVAHLPLAIERLSRLGDGHVPYELRHPWRDGTTHVGFLPLEFLEKLAALIPPERTWFATTASWPRPPAIVRP